MSSRSDLPIIFTDLDGTLLDRATYDCHAALPALDVIRTKNVPLVFCSSKTRAEQMELRERLGVGHPFIVEDGSAVYIDPGYFPFEFVCDRADDGMLVIRLGPVYDVVREAIRAIREETGIELTGYGDLTDEDVAERTGLDVESARRARQREFQESIVTPLAPDDAGTVGRALARRGLSLARGGRYYSVTGRSNKGAAALILAELYRRRDGDVRLVGIGDSFNDAALLRAMDVPVLVQKAPGTWEDIDVPNVVRVDDVGPAGWNRFVLSLLRAGPESAG